MGRTLLEGRIERLSGPLPPPTLPNLGGREGGEPILVSCSVQQAQLLAVALHLFEGAGGGFEDFERIRQIQGDALNRGVLPESLEDAMVTVDQQRPGITVLDDHGKDHRPAWVGTLDMGFIDIDVGADPVWGRPARFQLILFGVAGQDHCLIDIEFPRAESEVLGGTVVSRPSGR